MTYFMDCSDYTAEVKRNHLNMGGSNPAGDKIEVTSEYLTLNGEPWLPTMGELHHTRVSWETWEEEILKMKSAGIKIISTYMFWSHYEEEEGVFNFEGDRNIRLFLELCKKHDVYCLIRMGPWAHGEARYGGFPDWLMEKDINHRTLDKQFMAYTKNLYTRYFEHIDGLLFKQGGPVIAIQLDNEKANDAEYLGALKQLAIQIGYEVPLYTVTAWAGNGMGEFPLKEVLPMFGGYPEAPWTQHIQPLDPKNRFKFSDERNDATIGSDLKLQSLGKEKVEEILQDYPFFTGELGSGVQVCYHRRPIIEPMDVYAIGIIKLGSGANIPGYYMFHGGRNPYDGLYQESKDTNYANDLPVKTYDFQAPIGDFGLIRESFHYFRRLHTFLDDFGKELAPMKAYLPNNKEENAARFGIRTDGESGFVFINNHQRMVPLSDQVDFQLRIQLKDEVLTMPQQPVLIESGKSIIWPFNFRTKDILIKSMTMELISRLDIEDEEVLFVRQDEEIGGELILDAKTVSKVSTPHRAEGDWLIVDDIPVGLDKGIDIISHTGKKSKIIVLTSEESLKLYKANVQGQDTVYLSDEVMLFDQGSIVLYGALKETSTIYATSNIVTQKAVHKGNNGIFGVYEAQNKVIEKTPEITLKAIDKEPNINQYLPYLFAKGKEIGHYVLDIPKDIFETVEDLVIQFKFNGDVLQVCCEDELLGDCFNYCGTYQVGIKEWKKWIEEGKTIELRCSPLNGDEWVYLEIDVEPNKVAVEIEGIQPLYKIKL